MNSDAPNWNDVAPKLRRALGLSPPTPVEADRAISNAGEISMSEGEIRDIVSDVVQGKPQDHAFHPDHSWTDDVDTTSVAEDSRHVMNRNPGEEDDQVDKTVDELRKEALEDDEESDDKT